MLFTKSHTSVFGCHFLKELTGLQDPLPWRFCQLKFEFWQEVLHSLPAIRIYLRHNPPNLPLPNCCRRPEEAASCYFHRVPIHFKNGQFHLTSRFHRWLHPSRWHRYPTEFRHPGKECLWIFHFPPVNSFQKWWNAFVFRRMWWVMARWKRNKWG